MGIQAAEISAILKDRYDAMAKPSKREVGDAVADVAEDNLAGDCQNCHC